MNAQIAKQIDALAKEVKKCRRGKARATIPTALQQKIINVFAEANMQKVDFCHIIGIHTSVLARWLKAKPKTKEETTEILRYDLIPLRAEREVARALSSSNRKPKELDADGYNRIRSSLDKCFANATYEELPKIVGELLFIIDANL